MIQQAKWIWPKSKFDVHEFAEFYAPISIHGEKNVKIFISSKTNYAVFCNGQEVGYGQYNDYPDEKVYDAWELDGFLKNGENIIAIQAISNNEDFSSGIADGKGIIFSIEAGEKILLLSDENVLGRISTTYQSGPYHKFSRQLSYAFAYDFRGADDWLHGKGVGFAACEEMDPYSRFVLRPIKHLEQQIRKPNAVIDGNIYDFGRETVGYVGFEIIAEEETRLNLSFGEHLVDGKVRRKIHDRDFSVDFVLKKGINRFQERFSRFGCRYLQLDADNKIEVRALILREVSYPVTLKTLKIDGRQGDIYNVGIHTLRCCMHDHYEDCPWREQAQYVMDSRTQMLCGYLAFEEYDFARACLKLMVHRFNDEGFLPITTPCATNLSIPAFSLTYIVTLKEYVAYSGDRTLFEEVRGNAEKLLKNFIAHVKDGLLPDFPSWNFYEWSDGLGNSEEIVVPRTAEQERYSLPLNCFFILALDAYAELLGEEGANEYRALAEQLRENCRKRFYDAAKAEYFTYEEKGILSHKAEYTQYLAMRSGVEKDCAALCKKLTAEHDLIPLTLASYFFKYEVLLSQGGYEQYILEDIDRIWGDMLDKGATTFWETAKGEADFDGAGSLCHGWSAVPVYVYHKLIEWGIDISK